MNEYKYFDIILNKMEEKTNQNERAFKNRLLFREKLSKGHLNRFAFSKSRH